MRTLRSIRSIAGDAARLVSSLGWTLLALAVATWAVGALWGWREMQVASAMLVALLLLSVLFVIGHGDLDAAIEVSPPRVVVGERVAGQLRLTNRRGRAVRGLRIELPVGKAVASFWVSHLKGRDATEELFVVPTQRRAIIPVGPVTTIKGDPLGILRRTRSWSAVEEIFVHPRTVPLPTIGAGLIRDLEGQATSALSPSDIAFHTLRDYVPGDELRHVHWRSSAKFRDRLLVRQYNDTRRSHVAVVLSTDIDEYADDDEFELGVSCAASIAVQALRDEQAVTVIAGATQFPIHNAVRLLDRFSGIEAATGVGSLTAGLHTARRVAPDASTTVICVGSRVGVTRVRQATTHAGLEMPSVVLRGAATGGASRYFQVGNTGFVDVPDLESLNRGLIAVMAA